MNDLLYQDETYRALVAGFRAGAPPVAIDWLIEHGEDDHRAWELDVVVPIRPWDIWRFTDRGLGLGSGRGHGSGSGSGENTLFWGDQMEVGKAYIVHGGDWHTFIGRVKRQISPLTYEMESASKISETNNGDCWHELAAGNEELRSACQYAHIKTALIVPLTIAAIEWVGQTPQEAGL